MSLDKSDLPPAPRPISLEEQEYWRDYDNYRQYLADKRLNPHLYEGQEERKAPEMSEAVKQAREKLRQAQNPKPGTVFLDVIQHVKLTQDAQDRTWLEFWPQDGQNWIMLRIPDGGAMRVSLIERFSEEGITLEETGTICFGGLPMPWGEKFTFTQPWAMRYQWTKANTWEVLALHAQASLSEPIQANISAAHDKAGTIVLDDDERETEWQLVDTASCERARPMVSTKRAWVVTLQPIADTWAKLVNVEYPDSISEFMGDQPAEQAQNTWILDPTQRSMFFAQLTDMGAVLDQHDSKALHEFAHKALGVESLKQTALNLDAALVKVCGAFCAQVLVGAGIEKPSVADFQRATSHKRVSEALDAGMTYVAILTAIVNDVTNLQKQKKEEDTVTEPTKLTKDEWNALCNEFAQRISAAEILKLFNVKTFEALSMNAEQLRVILQKESKRREFSAKEDDALIKSDTPYVPLNENQIRARYTSTIKTKQGPKVYLAVAGRLLLFRLEHRAGRIETEIALTAESSVVFKATVFAADGTILATGHGWAQMAGSENYGGRIFEKAETAAIGRALAHAGFGTDQAGEDVDELSGEGEQHLADSPVTR